MGWNPAGPSRVNVYLFMTWDDMQIIEHKGPRKFALT
jgi:hypothetical protein